MITNDSVNKSRLSAAFCLLDESGLVHGTDEVPSALVENILNIRYGLEGELRRLSTEKDDSFILNCDGVHYLVKISSPAESRGVVEMQSAIMKWLNHHTAAWEVQNVITALDGESLVPVHTTSLRYMRVLTYLSGDILATVPVDEAKLSLTGRAAGEIDLALRGFAHQHDLRPLVWDLANIPTLAILQEELTDETHRALAAEAFERFTRNVVPLMGELETQVIHGDFSPYNILVSAESADFVSGIIDFGDAVRTCVIFEPAVSLCNLLGQWADDPWGAPLAYLRGYLSSYKMSPAHAVLIADAATARLALRAVVSQWRAQRLPDRREYIESHAKHDWDNLVMALATPVSDVQARIHHLSATSSF